jgi:glycosyltransferase involved in cell wall biosynthesis
MKKIFVSAYACEPNSGSEVGVGWHWVLEMSKYFELWVLTRKSNQPTIDSWLIKHPDYDNIHFVYYDLPKWSRFWKKGMRGVRIYYNLWQWCTDRLVKKVMTEHGIDIYHLLTYGNALWPASSYGQKHYFIWGPIGGVDYISEEYSKYYGWQWRTIECLRRTLIKSLPLNYGFLQRCKNANLILCKSKSMYEAIPDRDKRKAILFTDVAVEPLISGKYVKRRMSDGVVHYLMVGRLDAWRGFDIAIEAMALALSQNVNIHLNIVGKGSDRNRIIKWINKNRINDFVTLHGQVPINIYYQMMADSDVVLNPSLKEGGVTTAFDSIAFGKPLICIDTGGYTRYFNSDYSIVIPNDGRKKTIEKLANAILQLTDGELRNTLGQKAQTVGNLLSWDTKGKEIYKTITNHYESDNR